MKKGWLCLMLCLRVVWAQDLESETWRFEQEDIEFDGTASDDFFGISLQEVRLSGHFKDDVWAAARKVEFSGTTDNDARFAGLEVLTVDGTIGKNLRGISNAGSILVNTNAVIYGDAVLQAGKRVTVKGRILGDVWISSPNAVIGADILGDVTLQANEIQLLPGTVIHGDLYNRNDKPLPLPPGVEVKGERKTVSAGTSELENQIRTLKLTLLAVQFLTSFMIGLLMLRLLPRFTGHNVDLFLHHRNPSLSLGLFALIIFGLSGYLLLASIIGTGLGIFLLLVTGLLFYLGKIVVAYGLGLLIMRQKTDLTFGKLALGLFIGLVVLYSAYSLVYIGGVVYVMTSCWGMGTMLASIRHSQRVLKIQKPQSPNPPPPSSS